MMTALVAALLLCGAMAFWYVRRERRDPIVEKTRLSVLFKRSREGSDVQAMLELAHAYSEGIGVRKNKDLAEHWLGRSRDVFLEAIFQQSIHSLRSEPRHPELALEGLRLASGQGYAKAQLILAGLLVVGDDVPQDLVEGYRMANVVAESAIDESVRVSAEELLVIAEAQMSAEQVEEAKKSSSGGGLGVSHSEG